MKRLLAVLVALCAGLVLSVPGVSLAQNTQKKVITVGADTTFPPFEMEEHGKVTGFDIDLIHAIAKKEGLTIKMQTMDFQGLIPALQTGTIDVAVAGITITDQRAKVVDFSHPYYHSGLSLLVKKTSKVRSVEDLKGKSVAVKLGTTADLMMSKKAGVDVQRFTNIDDAYNQMQNGGAAAVVFDNPVNLNYAKSHKNVHVVGKLLTGEDYGIAVTKQAPGLLKKINDGLYKVYKSGEYKKLYRHYFGKDKNGFVKIGM
ncbi:MAG TPA: basic amino acid ABC transporter substrate-binding protein [Desulfuromonadales bacterium]|nr:basic amino acid ABC transporter substrate-binding protein [Desulfuromonadales bacterium]